MRSRLAGSRKQGSGPLWLRYYGLLLVAAVLAQAEQATDSQMHLIHSRSKAALRASGQLRQLRQLSNRPPAPSSTPTTPSNTPTTPITGPDGSLIEDKRVRVEDTTEFPFSTIGLLRVVGMDGSEWWCTAALVADKFALTAAHCLQYPPARRADFTPGYDPHSNHSEPYGTALVTDTWVLPAYLSCNEDPDCEHRRDFGLVRLDRTFDQWMNFSTDAYDPGGQAVQTAGYPADNLACASFEDFTGCSMYHTDCTDSTLAPGATFNQFSCFTFYGQSGSPVYINNPDSGELTIRGIETSGQVGQSGTVAAPGEFTVITQNVYDALVGWMASS